MHSRFGAYPYGLTRVFSYQRRFQWLLASDLRRAVTGVDSLAALEAALGPRRFEGLDPISASQCFLFHTTLPGYILVTLGDRQEMAHSVEGRTPFLDHELVELACDLPMHLKLAPQRNKHVLRCFVENVVADEAARHKHIFLAPSSRALGLDRRDSLLGSWLAPPEVRETNVFSSVAVSLLRKFVRLAGPSTARYAAAETLWCLLSR